MDETNILKMKPSQRLREFFYCSLPELENLPESIKLLKKVKPNETTNLLLTVHDIKWVHNYMESCGTNDDLLRFFEMMEGIEIVLPTPPIETRNPELEARIQKLKAEQSQREYRSMTKNVDSVRYREPEETIAAQIKSINRQLIAVAQFVISVGAGFLFGFTGIELMVGDLDFGFRLLLGVMAALIIALAEIYFLAKKLNEDFYPPADDSLKHQTDYNCDKLHQE